MSDADALYMVGPTLSGVLALSRRRSVRRVLAVHFHHTGVKPAWTWRGLYRLITARFDAVTFPSNFIRDEAIALWPALGPISHTVRNPLPLPAQSTAAVRADARRRLGLSPDAMVVGNAGWLIPRKRYDVFLQAAAVIRKSIPDIVFLVAGDGPESANLKTLATDLGLAKSIHWLGWQRDLVPFYQALDLLLFNADWDAFPTTPLEAMSHGVPVVASVLHGGLKEVIDCQDYGFLIDEHDTESLAFAAVELLRNPSDRAAASDRARARVADLCDSTKCVSDVERLLVK
jgi:glycosyltransferase involved in cell wall biosynthesis